MVRPVTGRVTACSYIKSADERSHCLSTRGSPFFLQSCKRQAIRCIRGNMSLGPSAAEEIIDAALVKYTRLTQKDLMKDPLAIKIQHCDSSTAICLVLEQHAGAFHDPKLMTSLNTIVESLYTLSLTPALSEVASPRVVGLWDYITSIVALSRFIL